MMWVWLIVLAAGPVWGGSLRSVPGKNWDKSDAAAVNVNFQKVDQSLGNTVTKTGTQTIVGEKSFSTMTVTNLTATNATVTTLTATNIVGTYSLGHKNLIINGGMTIDTRNSGSAVAVSTSAFPYSVDRFFGGADGAAITHQRVASGIDSFLYALRVTGAAGNTAAAVLQRIESLNIAHAHGQNLTYSCWLAASNTTSVEFTATYPSATDNYATATVTHSTTFTVTTALTQVSYTLTNASTTNGLQIRLRVNGLGAGHTFTTTGWQLELGPTTTAFEYRPMAVEQGLCQRYFYRAGYGASGTASDTDEISVGTTHPTSMRTAPTLSLAKTSIQIRTNGSASQTGSSCSLGDAAGDTIGWFIRMDGFSGLTAGTTIIQMHDSNWLNLSSEL